MAFPFTHSKDRVRRTAIHDYLSFTWCPKELEQRRKSATRYSKLIHAQAQNNHLILGNPLLCDGFLTQADVDSINAGKAVSQIRDMFYAGSVAMDLGEMENECTQELTSFFESVSIFWGKHAKLWERDKGMFGYKKSWDIHVEGTVIGIAAAGAKNGGCFISFTGAGCGTLDMQATYDVISALPLVKITRCDVAYDCYDGEFGVSHAKRAYKKGLFKTKGKYPDMTEISHYSRRVNKKSGKAKLVDNKQGRTIYVGSRQSGNMMRIYEKGRQLQGKGVHTEHDAWVRWEWELRSKDREIPMMILLQPAEYLAASSLVMKEIMTRGECVDMSTYRIRTFRKQLEVVLAASKYHAKHQYGGVINVMRNVEGLSDKEIVSALISDDPDKITKKMRLAIEMIPPEKKLKKKPRKPEKAKTAAAA